MENKTSEVKAVSYKNKSVLLFDSETQEEKWLYLDNKLNTNFVWKGQCEFQIKDDPLTGKTYITFIKMLTPKPAGSYTPKSTKPFTGGYTNPQVQVNKEKYWADKQETITRQWAINAALKILEINKEKVVGMVQFDTHVVPISEVIYTKIKSYEKKEEKHDEF